MIDEARPNADMDDLLAQIEYEALMEGPEAVVQLRTMQARNQAFARSRSAEIVLLKALGKWCEDCFSYPCGCLFPPPDEDP